jgi:hypothetical protein
LLTKCCLSNNFIYYYKHAKLLQLIDQEAYNYFINCTIYKL